MGRGGGGGSLGQRGELHHFHAINLSRKYQTASIRRTADEIRLTLGEFPQGWPSFDCHFPF